MISWRPEYREDLRLFLLGRDKCFSIYNNKGTIPLRTPSMKHIMKRINENEEVMERIRETAMVGDQGILG
jgi:hypothetical protein